MKTFQKFEYLYDIQMDNVVFDSRHFHSPQTRLWPFVLCMETFAFVIFFTDFFKFLLSFVNMIYYLFPRHFGTMWFECSTRPLNIHYYLSTIKVTTLSINYKCISLWLGTHTSIYAAKSRACHTAQLDTMCRTATKDDCHYWFNLLK